MLKLKEIRQQRKIINQDLDQEFKFNKGRYYFHSEREMHEFTDILDDEIEIPDYEEW